MKSVGGIVFLVIIFLVENIVKKWILMFPLYRNYGKRLKSMTFF